MTRQGDINGKNGNFQLLKECWNVYQATAHKFKVSCFGILKAKSRTQAFKIDENFRECFSD